MYMCHIRSGVNDGGVGRWVRWRLDHAPPERSAPPLSFQKAVLEVNSLKSIPTNPSTCSSIFCLIQFKERSVPPLSSHDRLRIGCIIGPGMGTTRAEDAQGTRTQSHIPPSVLIYDEKWCFKSRFFEVNSPTHPSTYSSLSRVIGFLLTDLWVN